MIQRFSCKLTDLLLDKGIVEKTDKEIYVYGFEALLSAAVNAVIFTLIGAVLGIFAETVLFLAAFSLLRVYCGGYHARTHLVCMLTFMAVYGLAMAYYYYLPQNCSFFLSLLFGGISLFIIFIYAPAEHKNRPLDADEYRKFRVLSRIIAVAEVLAIFIIGAFFPRDIKAAAILSMAMLSVAVMLAIAKIKTRKR